MKYTTPARAINGDGLTSTEGVSKHSTSTVDLSQITLDENTTRIQEDVATNLPISTVKSPTGVTKEVMPSKKDHFVNNDKEEVVSDSVRSSKYQW